MSRQYQIPGGCYINETATRQFQIPGAQYIDQTVVTATPTAFAFMGGFPANNAASTGSRGATFAD